MIHKLSPTYIIAISFVAVISFGALLLKMPFALEDGISLKWIDAFFMATSAVCVTGLTTVDPSSAFSLFGEIVLLLLIQIGGIGVMILASYFFLSLGRNMSIKQRFLIQESFAGDYDVNWRILVRTVIHYVVLIEIAGSIALSLFFMRYFHPIQSVYYGIFHSVSAFCNAGIALFPNSFISFRDNHFLNLIIIALIVAGGLGFFVIWELKQWWKLRRKRYRLSLHTKVVLITTLTLIVGGTLAIWLLESRNTAFGSTYLSRFWPSLFQAVSPRTAGFNTVDLAVLGNDSILLIMFLMFVGASPGSCGGGIKTTTFAVVFMLFWSRLRGGTITNMFKRTISTDVIGRSLGITVAAAFVLLLSNVLLMMTDFSGGHYARGRFVEIFFESISAFGTVGLSLGLTPLLNNGGKIIIMVLMYFGRVGVMAMFLQAVSSQKRRTIEYAEEGMMIG
jgi:trk system potassium uptake protein TrkH